MAQQFATRLATDPAARKQVGLSLPTDGKPTIVGPPMATPAPLGEARIGLTDDDPRRKAAALRTAGQAPTILGSKLG